jgi:hypothetical protein
MCFGWASWAAAGMRARSEMTATAFILVQFIFINSPPLLSSMPL